MSQVFTLLVLPAILLAALTACSPALERVEPWERDELAGDLMRPDLNTMEEGDWAEIYFSREGSQGGISGGGGGCGCN